MIRVIRGVDRGNFARELDAFHKIRKQVFFDTFRWDVPIINSWEIDGYDALNPVYLLSLDDAEQVVGGLRLLPTMGFNMLNDTFPQLLPEGKRIESPLIWESSRFSIDRAADSQIGPKRISRAIAELGIGMNEFGARLGLSHIVTVYDAILHRHLLRVGCAGRPLGEPQRIGASLAYAVLFDVGPAAETAAREASGIEGSVLEPDAAPLLIAA
jgi:N-acyl-L-homoserine lactone synthetase